MFRSAIKFRNLIKNSNLNINKRNLNIGIIGAPINAGQPKLGVENGPKIIRDTQIIQKLQNLGHDVKDYGDVTISKEEPITGPDGEKNHNIVMDFNKKLADSVSDIISDDRLCVTLGGDHSLAIGTIQGHAHAKRDKQVVVLWIDAHADLNTGCSSWSGNMHGMSMAHSLYELNHKINKLNNTKWPVPCVRGQHVAYIGLRDIDEAEQKSLNDFGILWFSVRDVDELGINEVIERCLIRLNPSNETSLHLSFDIDALDPSVAPSTGTPVPGGLTLREGMSIVEAASKTGFLSALDLVEVNPSLTDSSGAQFTSTAAKHLLLAGLAHYRGI